MAADERQARPQAEEVRQGDASARGAGDQGSDASADARDLVQAGGHALGLSPDEASRVSRLSGQEMEQLQNRTANGEDFRAVLADLSGGSRAAPAAGPGATPALDDEILRLHNNGRLSDDDVFYILDGSDAGAMSTRLAERQEANLTRASDSETYPAAVAEVQRTTDPDRR